MPQSGAGTWQGFIKVALGSAFAVHACDMPKVLGHTTADVVLNEILPDDVVGGGAFQGRSFSFDTSRL